MISFNVFFIFIESINSIKWKYVWWKILIDKYKMATTHKMHWVWCLYTILINNQGLCNHLIFSSLNRYQMKSWFVKITMIYLNFVKCTSTCSQVKCYSTCSPMGGMIKQGQPQIIYWVFIGQNIQRYLTCSNPQGLSTIIWIFSDSSGNYEVLLAIEILF